MSHDPLESIVNCFINVGKSCAVSVCVCQVTFIYMALFTIQIISKQIYRDN